MKKLGWRKKDSEQIAHLKDGHKAFQGGHTPAASIGGHANTQARGVVHCGQDGMEVGEEALAQDR